MVDVYIALGSNLGDREENIKKAINLVRENSNLVKKNEELRGRDLKNVDVVLKLDQQWKSKLKSYFDLLYKFITF